MKDAVRRRESMGRALGSLLVACIVLSLALVDWRKSSDWISAGQLVVWMYRIHKRDPTVKQDLGAVVIVQALKLCLSGQGKNGLPIQTVWQIPLAAAISAIGFLRLSRRESASEAQLEEQETNAIKGPFPPLLFPSKTTHMRLFPQKHGFGYSYLLVGVPVGWRGTIGSLISVDEHLLPQRRRKNGWFHVRAADYLERGGEGVDLKTKLSEYLRSQVCIQQ